MSGRLTIDRITLHCSSPIGGSSMRHAIPMLLAIAIIIAMSGCETVRRHQAGDPPPRPAVINHVVLFKLKNPGDADELIGDCDRMLAKIPGIVSYYAGRRLEMGRPRAETNFDVGFYVGFTTQEEYTAYLSHPDHVAAVTKWNSRCESIRIQDVIDQTP